MPCPCWRCKDEPTTNITMGATAFVAGSVMILPLCHTCAINIMQNEDILNAIGCLEALNISYEISIKQNMLTTPNKVGIEIANARKALRKAVAVWACQNPTVNHGRVIDTQ